MRPKNFPARRNARRIRALERFQAHEREGNAAEVARRRVVMDATQLNLFGASRDTRTKKDRTNFARFAR